MKVSNVDHVTVYVKKATEHSFISSDGTSLTGFVSYENVKCDMVSLPGTSEEERTDCIIRKSERGIFQFSHQTQTQETRIHKKGEPGRKVQVCLLTCHSPPSFGVVPFFFLIFFIFYFIDLSSLELPYVTPLENKQRKSFTSKALYPLANIPKARAMQKQRCECQEESVKDDSALCPGARLVSDMFDLTVDGKLEDARPLLRVKLLSSSSVPELGHSSGSEGEKEFASPEWDVPLSKTSLRKTRSKSIFLYLSHHSECYAKLCLLFFVQKQIVFSRSPSRPWMQTLS